MRHAFLCGLLTIGLIGCASPKPIPSNAQATSLLGKPLFVPDVPADQRATLDANLAAAQVAFHSDPSEDNAVWLGRRLAYLGHYKEAIDVFTQALERYPDSAKLLRHRGHRYITIRRFDDAIHDLGCATDKIRNRPDEIEPDGAPNARNLPRSTLNSNIWYHLGLAHYLKGSYEHAAMAFGMCLDFSRDNDDKLVSTSYWLYLSRLRTGDQAGAAAILQDIRPDMDAIENQTYHRLLLCFKGTIKPQDVGHEGDALSDVTMAYGLAMRRVLRGEAVAAKADFERIIASPNWAAFGYIAAEAELARSK